MNEPTRLEDILDNHLQEAMCALETLSTKYSSIEAEISGLTEELSEIDVQRRENIVRVKTLEQLQKASTERQNPPATAQTKSDAVAMATLGVMQRKVLGVLHDHPNAAKSSAEIQRILNSQGHSIKRRAAIHKTLVSLEDRKLATYKKEGRAFYWYKTA